MSGEPTTAPPEASARTTAATRAHWKRRSRAVALPPDQAARQGAISQLAFKLLGREAAIEFLNSAHEGLGGRPLAIATTSVPGRDTVEAELARVTREKSLS